MLSDFSSSDESPPKKKKGGGARASKGYEEGGTLGTSANSKQGGQGTNLPQGSMEKKWEGVTQVSNISLFG